MLKRGILALAIVALVAAIPVSPAGAAGFKLHPSGFGEQSYCAWKAGEGLPDNSGTANQALYFQKMTSTTTFAAGVAIFKGFEGMLVSDLTALEFKWGTDGHCGAGAPRFNLRIDPDGPGPAGPAPTIFFGCLAMIPGSTATAPNSRMFQTKTALGPFAPATPAATIVSLAIVFDEGTDQGPGFVYLDDIRVGTTTGDHVWSSASDNGGSPTSGANSIAEVELLLGEPVSVLFR
jgi:hypothetical protein